MNISGIFTVQKAKRGSEFLNPEYLKSINISGIFTAKGFRNSEP
jgi:predicted PolB exonuclease-like 3'-5' exonuclease